MMVLVSCLNYQARIYIFPAVHFQATLLSRRVLEKSGLIYSHTLRGVHAPLTAHFHFFPSHSLF